MSFKFKNYNQIVAGLKFHPQFVGGKNYEICMTTFINIYEVVSEKIFFYLLTGDGECQVVVIALISGPLDQVR